MKYILFALLIYAAYQFIFNLVIPVYKTTRKIRKGFREMHAHMQSQSGADKNGSTSQPSSYKPMSKANPDDYIDFEEVK